MYLCRACLCREFTSSVRIGMFYYMSDSRSSFLDRILRLLFNVSCCALLIVIGAAGQYFNWSIYRPLQQAFLGGEAWYENIYNARHAAPADPKHIKHEDNFEALLGVMKEGAASHWDKEKSFNGYTLVAIRMANSLYLLDMQGKVAHEWRMGFDKTWPNPTHINKTDNTKTSIHTAHLFPNGDVIVQYDGVADTPYGYGLAKFDKDSNLLWRFSDNTHHDFSVDSAGNVNAIVHHITSDPIKGLEQLSYPALSDYLVTLSPSGEELERISVFEALRDSPYASMFNKASMKKKEWDYTHVNSVMMLDADMAYAFPMFAAGDLLISIRNFNMVAVVDGKTHKVKWMIKEDWFRHQHDARFLYNGHILFFDNHMPNDKSGATEVDPVTGKVTWVYDGSPDNQFTSEIRGRVQRLPNDNTLVTDSRNRTAYEVTEDKAIVWQYVMPKVKNKHAHIDLMDTVRYSAAEVPFLKE